MFQNIWMLKQFLGSLCEHIGLFPVELFHLIVTMVDRLTVPRILCSSEGVFIMKDNRLWSHGNNLFGKLCLNDARFHQNWTLSPISANLPVVTKILADDTIINGIISTLYGAL